MKVEISALPVKPAVPVYLHALASRLCAAAALLLALLQVFAQRLGQAPALGLAAALRLVTQAGAVPLVFAHLAARSGAARDHST